MGLSVLPPDVNASRADFAVTGEREIRFGLTAVKGVGENAVGAILDARAEGGAFTSIWDFCRRVDQAQVNKRALESLVRAGAFDSTGGTRLGILEALPAAMGAASRARSDAAAGQESLFGGLAPDTVSAPVDLDPPVPAEEFSREDLLAAEKEALGLYVSSHPLQDCRNQLARAVTCSLGRLDEHPDGAVVTVGGIIGAIKAITTRRGEPMMFVRLDDLEGSVEVVVVPAVLTEAREQLVADGIVLIQGRIDQKGEGETKIVARTVESFAVDPDREEHRLTLRVHASQIGPGHIPRLRQLLVDHGGEAPVVMVMETDDGTYRYRFGDRYRVNPRDGSLQASLKTLLGAECVVR